MPALEAEPDVTTPAAPAAADPPPTPTRTDASRWQPPAGLRPVLWWGLFALFTVWTGLVALYFGRPWGSIVDYGTAFVWGLGIQLLLQLVAGRLVRGGPFRAGGRRPN
jgi:hypothetical protein